MASAAHPPADRPHGRLARIGAMILHEIREVIPPTLFFFVGFNVILLTKRLLLEQYLIAYAGFVVATTGALIVGKVVLVADKLPLLRRFDHAPLAWPILFKALCYTVLVMAARLLEALVHFLAAGGALGGGRFIADVLGQFSWPHFIAVQLWIFVLFLVYVTACELNALFGDGELFRILFRHRSNEVKSVRRARIRLLTRLMRLTEAHSLADLQHPGSPANRELAGILRRLRRH
ncbi:MAG: hypothetical protein AB7F35_04705 [Acetobacteraceae bacterium]